MRSIQNEMVQSKKELATRELSIQRARDELSLAHVRMTQESERVNALKKSFKAGLMFSIPLRTIVFVTEWVLATLKIFFFDFYEKHKHAMNVLLKSQSVIIRNFKKVYLEKWCLFYVLQINPGIL